MVLSVREHGFDSADFLADLANEALAQADDLDRRANAGPDTTAMK
jgi:hypothetical protein